jgi:hypothetical protein
MYRFSRSIYRELSPRVVDEGVHNGEASPCQHLLEASEATMRRLAYDRRYFARPARSLFNEVRQHFPISEQQHVYEVIDRYVGLAVEFLERLPEDVGLDGRPRHCRASTRKGKPCQREPLPGRDYCPSHKHLEETFEQLEQQFEKLDEKSADKVGAAA